MLKVLRDQAGLQDRILLITVMAGGNLSRLTLGADDPDSGKRRGGALFFFSYPKILILLAVAFFCVGLPLMKLLLVQRARRNKAKQAKGKSGSKYQK